MNSIIMSFKPVFSRTASFRWFVIVGFIVSGDGIGITSIIRELCIAPKHYESLIHFFRSSVWEINKLSKAWVKKAWVKIVKNNAPILTVLELVTKSKISLKAYTDPPVYSGKGRPRLKGDSVKLKDLFTTAADEFVTADICIYGKIQTIQYYSIDLLWGTKL